MKRFHLAILNPMAAVLFAASASSAPPPAFQLVGINDRDQSQGVDELVNFDPATGVGTVVGSLGDAFVNCEALSAFNGFNISTSAGFRTLFTVDEHRLVVIDQFTGQGFFLQELGFPDVDGIAFLGVDLYGVTYGSSQIIRVVDAANAPIPVVQVAASDVLVSHHMNDIAFLPNALPGAHAFIITDDTPTKIYEVDPNTGNKFHKWVISGPTSMEALVPMFLGPVQTAGANYVFLSAADRGNGKDLVRIDLPVDSEVGTATFLGAPSGFRDIEGLTWVPNFVYEQLIAALNGGPTDATPAARFALHQNAPNPFNPSTQIQFELSERQDVELSVYDAAGRVVATLARGAFPAGPHVITWDGRTSARLPAAAGVYRYVLRGMDWRTSRSMVLVK